MIFFSPSKPVMHKLIGHKLLIIFAVLFTKCTEITQCKIPCCSQRRYVPPQIFEPSGF